MKKLLAILFLFASFLGAETRYLIVSGDKAKPIPSRMAAKATHTVELTVEQMKNSGSPDAWKVINGQPVLKTDEERQTEVSTIQKRQAQEIAFKLADKVKQAFITERGGKIYEFSPYSQLSFRIEYKSMADTDKIRVRVKGEKSVKLNKANADLLYSLLEAHSEAVEDALEDDIDAIKTGDFSLSNLKAIKAAQEALKK